MEARTYEVLLNLGYEWLCRQQSAADYFEVQSGGPREKTGKVTTVARKESILRRQTLAERLRDLILGPSVKPYENFRDDVLGELTFDPDLGWTGKFNFLGEIIEFDLYDIYISEDSLSLTKLKNWLLGGEESLNVVQDYIRKQLRDTYGKLNLSVSDFKIRSVGGFRSDDPGFFLIFLDEINNPERLWRITFVEGRPKYLDFDT